MSIKGQLDELRILKDGWLDGFGLAPDPAGLNWLEGALAAHYPGSLPEPRIYPTYEGEARLEWRLGPEDISLDINLIERLGYFHSFNLETKVVEACRLKLHSDAAWAWVIGRLQEFQDDR